MVWVLLRVLGAHRAAKLLLRNVPLGESTDNRELLRWRERAERLRSVSRFLPGANCLARALTLSWWAQRQGLAAEVRIGVKPTSAGIEAHAWSVLGGQLLDEQANIVAQFTRVPFPGVSAMRISP